jgi:hypothetical protein
MRVGQPTISQHVIWILSGVVVIVAFQLFYRMASKPWDPSLVSTLHILSGPSYWALRDALQCMGLPDDPQAYLHPQAERETHCLWLHTEISKMIPSNFPQFCWLTSCGPWSEEIWCDKRTLNFSEFGPFVPLFVPWVSIWSGKKPTEYWAVLTPIFALLSSKYLYVTVSHNDDGLEGTNEPTPPIPRNLFVLSQGGKGHIPLLLWLNEVNPANYPNRNDYEYDLVFMGGDGSHWLRMIVKREMQQLGNRAHWSWSGGWELTYQRSKFVLAPRGYGRNSYRLAEVLMRGMLPVYVYNDIVWLPYYDSINWSSIGIVVRWDQLNKTFGYMQTMPVSRVNEMRSRVRSLYPTHFSSRGTFDQIMKLLKGGFAKSDLRCAIYSNRTNVPGQEKPPA